MELCLSFHLAEPLGLIRLFVVGVFAQTSLRLSLRLSFCGGCLRSDCLRSDCALDVGRIHTGIDAALAIAAHCGTEPANYKSGPGVTAGVFDFGIKYGGQCGRHFLFKDKLLVRENRC